MGNSNVLSHPVTISDTAASPLTVKVLRSVEEVEAIRDVWAHWKTHRDSDIDFCLRFVWRGHEFMRPHVIALYQGTTVVALLVGRIDRARLNLRVGYFHLPSAELRLLTVAYRGCLGGESAEINETLVRSIRSALKNDEADAALFHQADVTSDLYQRVKNSSTLMCRDHLVRAREHCIMNLAPDLDGVFRGMSSGLRAEVRRKKKKLFQDFGDRAKIVCVENPADLPHTFPQLEEVAKKTYQRGLGVGFVDNKQMRTNLAFCAEQGWLRIYLLTISDKPVAFWIGTVYNNVFCSDYNGYDPQFREYSLGTVLLIHGIEDFCKQGLKAIDFGMGEAEYKGRFGNYRLQEASIYLFAPRFKGWALNASRTIFQFLDETARNALERTNLLPRIKRLWRKQLASQKSQDK